MAGHGDTSETIVIVGGGICGIAVALALHRFFFLFFRRRNYHILIQKII